MFRQFRPRRDEPEGEGAPPTFFVHHQVPLTFGGDELDDGLIATTLPPINRDRARRPVTPGMPPLWLPPLPPPHALKLVPPPGISTAPPVREPSHLVTPDERIRFPVPPSPGFAPLAPAPPAGQPAPILKTTLPPADAAPAAATAALPAAVEEAARPARRERVGDRVDPIYPLVFYLAVSVGSMTLGSLLNVEARYTVLWTVLIGMGALLTLVDARHRRDHMAPGNLVWGLGIGFVIGLPLLILTGPGLAATASALFPEMTLPALFQALVIAGPLGETLFFRGALQEKRGMVASVIGAGAHNVLFFLPVALLGSSAYVTGAGIFYLTALAWVYSYVRRRYGLTAAFLCQATANMMLLFVPSLIAALTAAPERIP